MVINNIKLGNKFKKIDGLYLCGILSALIAILSLGWIYIADKGIFTLRDDFNVQQIPFTYMAHNTLLEGLDGWCWNLDLGTSLIQGLSFYNLGSPFFWVTMLLPTNAFPYVVGILYIIKYIVAGMTAYIYINLFTKRQELAVFGALLYAFSGFQASNLLFYHFHDVVAFFPIMLYGLEKAMADKRNCKIFIFSVFLNAILNYYFFVQEAVFLLMYFIARFLNGSFKEIIQKVFRCGLSCLLGIGMSAVLFLPNIMFILSNPRSQGTLSLSRFTISAQYLFLVIKGFLFPGEAMHDHSSIINNEWSSTSIYMPLFGIALALSYLFTKKDWLSGLLKFMFIASIIPIVSSAFLMFTESTRRWWFMFSLIIALASALCLEKREEFKITKGVFINIAVLILFYIIVRKLPLYHTDTQLLVYHPVRMTVYLIFVIIGLILSFVFLKLKKLHIKSIIAFVAVFAILSTASTAALYKRNSTSAEDYKTILELASKLENFDEQYRYNDSSNMVSMLGSVAGTSSFCSTVNYSILELDYIFDYHEYVRRMDKNLVKGLPELLGAKYKITDKKSEGDNSVKTINTRDKTFYIVENAACPIGFAVDSYILYDDVKKIEKENRAIALLDAAVIYAADAERISTIVSKLEINEVDLEKSIEDYVKEAESRAVSDFSRNSKGFKCNTNYSEDSLVYFSVPYDKGWTAYIDGAEVEFVNSCGMILLPVSKGEHNIEFKYNTPGLKFGMYISIVSILVYVVIILMQYKQKKHI